MNPPQPARNMPGGPSHPKGDDVTTDAARPAPGTLLTLEQIPAEGVYDDVRVTTCGEDGEPLLAIGTHDLHRVEAAWSRYLQHFVGDTLHDYLSVCLPGCRRTICCASGGCSTLRSITQRQWWLFRADSDYGWASHVVDAYTPDAIPVVSA